MTNNDIIRRLRYTFDFEDEQMIAIFASAEHTVTRSEVSDWLKKDDDPECKEISDELLAVFLNGLINERRGKREGAQMPPERELSNNMILRKLKIAMNFKDEDMLETLAKGNMVISKHELSALFRNVNHHHYRPCQDQFLRNFLNGLQQTLKG